MNKIDGVEYDINKRWETGMDHHPKSVELFKRIAALDFEVSGDYFCWKYGGDGDNGEHMMYELDIFFEEQEKKHPSQFAGLTLGEISKTHKDNELVKALVAEIVRLRRGCP
jgi:hypothetical protein